MSATVCLSAHTMSYPEGGGHLWAHLNWALGLRSLGCKVLWLERARVTASNPVSRVMLCVETLKKSLRHSGSVDCVFFHPPADAPLPKEVTAKCLGIEAAAEADL